MTRPADGLYDPRNEHDAWRTEIGATQEYRYPPVGMARAFSVPAIAVYSGEVIHFPNEDPRSPYIAWSPPSLSLALAVLRLAIDQQKLLVEPMQGDEVLKVLWGVEAMVRSHYPMANAYRLRLAEGDWGERIYQR